MSEVARSSFSDNSFGDILVEDGRVLRTFDADAIRTIFELQRKSFVVSASSECKLGSGVGCERPMYYPMK